MSVKKIIDRCHLLNTSQTYGYQCEMETAIAMHEYGIAKVRLISCRTSVVTLRGRWLDKLRSWRAELQKD